MRGTIFAAFCAALLSACPNSFAQLPYKGELLERIEKAKKKASRSKDGHVIVGQVVVEDGDDPALVKTQMEILDNGFFAGCTHDLLRPVGFRMHGYAPYDLELGALDADVVDGNVVDVGVVKMKRLEQSELVSLKGLLTLQDSGDPKTATVSLSVANGPVNTPSNGTEPRRRWAKSIKVPISETGLFDCSGFSPIKYYCSVKAPGYVSHGFHIDFAKKNGAFTGRIKLEKPRRVDIEFIQAENGNFDLESAKKTVKAGGDRWKVTPEIYGWDLEFVQEREKLFFKYSYAPCLMVDLGEADLSDFLNTDPAKATESARNMEIQNGHVYLMRQKFWDRDVLFRVQVEQREE